MTGITPLVDTTPRTYNINEASKTCGLSPSVLRIWELRYGWPNPKRLANGYRCYTQHLVDDLGRMAKLVKAGTPIRQLIKDSLPQWPEDPDNPSKPRTIDHTRSITAPRDRTSAQLQQEVLDAVEQRRGGAVRELIDRISWLVRPTDEARTGLIPMVVGMAELGTLDRNLGNHQAGILSSVNRRCEQLLRSLSHGGDAIMVTPSQPEDTALAGLTAVALTSNGHPARVCADTSDIPADCTVVFAGGDKHATTKGIQVLARVSALPEAGATPLIDLVDHADSVDWLK